MSYGGVYKKIKKPNDFFDETENKKRETIAKILTIYEHKNNREMS